ncbi:hypothetical protein G7182_004573, partial [Salmonella enterica]|nr:hypothetical protein [Salmonella enterica]
MYGQEWEYSVTGAAGLSFPGCDAVVWRALSECACQRGIGRFPGEQWHICRLQSLSEVQHRTLNGHYDSTFAVSSTGLVWGNRGGNESSLSGVVVDARNNSSENISGPVAKITATQSGDAYVHNGQQTFMPLMDYTHDDVTVENAGTQGANGNLVRGAGKHDVFQLPGHVTVSRLRADAV